MDQFEEKLKQFIENNSIDAQHYSFSESCHSVEDAAKAVGAQIDDFVKNICLIDEENRVIVAIVKGEGRVSTSRVGKALDIQRPRIATQEEILEKTGYPCGGTPSFGFDGVFVVDEKVMEQSIVYTGGGSQQSLVKISPKELLLANNGLVTRIRK